MGVVEGNAGALLSVVVPAVVTLLGLLLARRQRRAEAKRAVDEGESALGTTLLGWTEEFRVREAKMYARMETQRIEIAGLHDEHGALKRSVRDLEARITALRRELEAWKRYARNLTSLLDQHGIDPPAFDATHDHGSR